MNKPAGVVSTASDTHGRPIVTDLVDSDLRLYPVGRLDADTTGLILLTNDGELAERLTHPRYEVPKTYRARVRPAAAARPAGSRALREGRRPRRRAARRPPKARQVEPGVIEVTIHEGRKRQVRRMLAGDRARGRGARARCVRPAAPRRAGLRAPPARLSAAEVERLRQAAWKNPSP